MQIIDIQYIGSLDWYKILFQNTNIVFDTCVLHQKASKWNTTLVPGANGVVRLTVPLAGGRSNREALKDLRIAYKDNWVLQHVRTLDAAFMRAPFYEFYRDGLLAILESRPEKLLDLNLALLDWTLQKLKWPGVWTLNTEGLLQRSPDVLAGPAVSRTYPQVFEDRNGFQPGMSIIDLMAALGPGAREFLSPIQAAQ